MAKDKGAPRFHDLSYQDQVKEIAEATDMPIPTVMRTLKQLYSKKILIREGDKISINTNYDEWEKQPVTEHGQKGR